MDKNKKVAVSLFSLFAIPAGINKAIFINANFKNKEITKGEVYDWRLGKINYNVYGSGKPILLIHSIGVGHSQIEWNKNINVLSEKYKVYVIDLLGFGYSDKPNMTYTAYMYSSLINDFIDEVIKRPVAVISSYNAASIVLMSQSEKPKNFKKMMLIEPSISDNNLAQNNDKIIKKIFNLPIIGTSIYNYMASKNSLKSKITKELIFSKELLAKDDLIENMYLSSHIGNSSAKYPIGSFITNFINMNTLHLLKNIKIPIYIVWGEDSRLNNTIENMNKIREIRPDIDYFIFEETKLYPHYENNIEFNKLVVELFN